MSTRLKKTGTS